jgi:hypothetical protein
MLAANLLLVLSSAECGSSGSRGSSVRGIVIACRQRGASSSSWQVAQGMARMCDSQQKSVTRSSFKGFEGCLSVPDDDDKAALVPAYRS